MQETTGNSSITMWLAGIFFVAWNSLLTLILGFTLKKTGELSKDREDHCIPRPECERTHAGVDRQVAEIKEGINGIHERLDKIIGCRGKE